MIFWAPEIQPDFYALIYWEIKNRNTTIIRLGALKNKLSNTFRNKEIFHKAYCIDTL